MRDDEVVLVLVQKLRERGCGGRAGAALCDRELEGRVERVFEERGTHGLAGTVKVCVDKEIGTRDETRPGIGVESKATEQSK